MEKPDYSKIDYLHPLEILKNTITYFKGELTHMCQPVLSITNNEEYLNVKKIKDIVDMNINFKFSVFITDILFILEGLENIKRHLLTNNVENIEISYKNLNLIRITHPELNTRVNAKIDIYNLRNNINTQLDIYN